MMRKSKTPTARSIRSVDTRRPAQKTSGRRARRLRTSAAATPKPTRPRSPTPNLLDGMEPSKSPLPQPRIARPGVHRPTLGVGTVRNRSHDAPPRPSPSPAASACPPIQARPTREPRSTPAPTTPSAPTPTACHRQHPGDPRSNCPRFGPWSPLYRRSRPDSPTPGPRCSGLRNEKCGSLGGVSRPAANLSENFAATAHPPSDSSRPTYTGSRVPRPTVAYERAPTRPDPAQ